jgi:purine-nucleoside phosphorylase
MQAIREAVAYIQAHSNNFQPTTGIILGTGLGALAKEVAVQYEISYADIPNFPVSTVESHAGRLLLGTLNGQPVAVLQGRFHYYGATPCSRWCCPCGCSSCWASASCL